MPPRKKPASQEDQDLFEAAVVARLAKDAPLASRLRPTTLDELVGQEHLIGEKGPLRALIQTGTLSSLLLWGPPGSGKTTIARLVATETDADFVTLSAVSAGVKEVRETIDGARHLLAEQGRRTVLFLDEIHRFSKAQQDALLPGVENGTIVLVGATTENPFFALTSPLQSRSTLYKLDQLEPHHLDELASRALETLAISIVAEARALLVDRAGGDARALYNALEVAAALTRSDQREAIEVDDAESALQFRRLPADRAGDAHYDQISAFIKSMRGSDPDAALYWMARMLQRGEDPRYIARRIVIAASEDVGLADPRAMVVAVAAFQALEFVGMPEAFFSLAEAVVYIARAPKSNSMKKALAVLRDVDELPSEPVPVHLRDTSYFGARKLGHGKGYLYPHDFPGHQVEQEYRPPAAAGKRWYEPSGEGEEVP